MVLRREAPFAHDGAGVGDGDGDMDTDDLMLCRSADEREGSEHNINLVVGGVLMTQGRR